MNLYQDDINSLRERYEIHIILKYKVADQVNIWPVPVVIFPYKVIWVKITYIKENLGISKSIIDK